MIRALLVVIVVLFGIAATSGYQAVRANQQIGKLEAALSTVATQYGQARERYDQLDALTAERQEAQAHERNRLQRQLAALRNAPADECTDRRVPAAIADILRNGIAGGASVPSGAGRAAESSPSP
uniref:hypothetical protein n=1 Tax=Marinobacterium profundum TaxID=1714300 RepID=UPI00082A145A|nr:hypothetical protein [Marinobacterium profundum]